MDEYDPTIGKYFIVIFINLPAHTPGLFVILCSDLILQYLTLVFNFLLIYVELNFYNFISWLVKSDQQGIKTSFFIIY